jgi:hypothetical protein
MRRNDAIILSCCTLYSTSVLFCVLVRHWRSAFFLLWVRIIRQYISTGHVPSWMTSFLLLLFCPPYTKNSSITIAVSSGRWGGGLFWSKNLGGIAELCRIAFASYNQCGGSESGSVGSIYFGPPGSASGSINQIYGSDSGSFYHQAKVEIKTLIPTVLWLLYDFLSLKNDVNVRYLQKVISKKKFLLTSWRSLTKIAGSGFASGAIVRGMDPRIRIRFTPKFHGSATLAITSPNVYTLCTYVDDTVEGGGVEEGLSKEDVSVALNFLHVWHQKQCMCVFR